MYIYPLVCSCCFAAILTSFQSGVNVVEFSFSYSFVTVRLFIWFWLHSNPSLSHLTFPWKTQPQPSKKITQKMDINDQYTLSILHTHSAWSFCLARVSPTFSLIFPSQVYDFYTSKLTWVCCVQLWSELKPPAPQSWNQSANADRKILKCFSTLFSHWLRFRWLNKTMRKDVLFFHISYTSNYRESENGRRSRALVIRLYNN